MLKQLFYNYKTFSTLLVDNQSSILQHCLRRTTNIIFIKNNSNIVSKEQNVNKAEDEHLKKNTREQKEKNIEFAQNDPDTFGTLPGAENFKVIHEPKGDEGDRKDEEYCQQLPRRRYSTKKYANLIKMNFKKGNVREAIDVLEKQMLKVDRVVPNNYIYNLIITHCSQLGYTKKVFQLYNQMKKRGLKPTGATYTALFNSCALCPFPHLGLQKANSLRDLIALKGIQLNTANYNSMIKAYGRCGDIQSAFSIIDEMRENKIPLDERTLNTLLQACISDKNGGFLKVLWLWRRMIGFSIKPNIYSFNLLIRATRDCSIGDSDKAHEILNNILQEGTETQALTEPSTSTDHLEGKKIPSPSIEDVTMNLLTPVPHFEKNLVLSEIATPSDRLILIGGIPGLMQQMKTYNVTPDIITFTQLLNIIPSTKSAEKALLKIIQKMEVKFDVDFFNMLIKKRSFRFDYEAGREALALISQHRLQPDIVTFGVLALGCQTKEQAQELISTMRASGFRMNKEILGAMLDCAIHKMNFPYILDLFPLFKENHIKPSYQNLHKLENFKEKLYLITSGKYIDPKTEKRIYPDQEMKRNIRLFLKEYKSWKRSSGEPDVPPHPWHQLKKKPEEENAN